MRFTLEQIKTMIADTTFYILPTEDFFLNGRYDQQAATGNAMKYYRLFHYISKIFKPRVTVELGGWQGSCAAHIAAGNRNGTVITIDHHGDPGDDVHMQKMNEVCMRYSNVQYLKKWTWDAVDDVKRYGEIDFLFIDSWHNYEYAMRDWKDYSPMLADGALVVCDDLLVGGNPGDPIYQMRKFWDELDYPKFLDETLHPGFPMGFLRYENRS